MATAASSFSTASSPSSSSFVGLSSFPRCPTHISLLKKRKKQPLVVKVIKHIVYVWAHIICFSMTKHSLKLLVICTLVCLCAPGAKKKKILLEHCLVSSVALENKINIPQPKGEVWQNSPAWAYHHCCLSWEPQFWWNLLGQRSSQDKPSKEYSQKKAASAQSLFNSAACRAKTKRWKGS